MAEELGVALAIGGRVEYALPGPTRLSRLEGFPGLSSRTVKYLRTLAREAGEGRLDAGFLRTLPVEEALAALQKALSGIGPFGAELILLRGVGVPDQLPLRERRLGRAVAPAYGLAQPPAPEQLAEMVEAWRPHRTWVALLLRTFLEDETHEISGQPEHEQAATAQTGDTLLALTHCTGSDAGPCPFPYVVRSAAGPTDPANNPMVCRFAVATAALMRWRSGSVEAPWSRVECPDLHPGIMFRRRAVPDTPMQGSAITLR